MWQDSGRYEWPLTGAYPALTEDSTALVTNPYDRWYDPVNLTGSPLTSGGVLIDTRPYPERAEAEIAALGQQVEALKAENCDLLIGHAELTRRINDLMKRVAELERGQDAGTQ